MENSFRRRILRINTLTSTYRGVWEEIRLSAPLPPRRFNHSSVIMGENFIVYGGHDISIGVFQDMWVLKIDLANAEKMKWAEVVGLGDLPRPLCRHTAVVYNELMYLYGGTDLYAQSNSIYTFDLSNFTWQEFLTQAPYLDSHTAVVLEGKMILFGGYQGSSLSNEVYVIDLDTKICKHQEISNKPLPRAGHQAGIHNSSMWVCGGTFESTHLQDLWKLNLRNFTWEEISAHGEVPGGVSGHTICIYGDVLLLFGGTKDEIKESNEMYTYDFKNNLWVLISTETEVSDPVSSDQYEKVIKKREEAKKVKKKNDTSQEIRLYQGPQAPSKGRIRGKVPYSRDGHSANLYDNYMIIFGGDRYHMAFNDTYIYSVTE